MSSYYDIPVIIPAYEPDEKLNILLHKLKEAGIVHIVVVDDGSGSAYQSLFERAAAIEGCEVLTHSVNLGKGRALKTAFNHCLLQFPEVCGCVTADSDGQHTPQDILSCMKKLTDNPEALILGCRNFDAPDIPARSVFGNKCTRKVFSYLVGLSVSDTQTGLRAIPSFFMKELMNVKGERFEYETNMLIETKNLHIPVLEVPVETIYLEENKTSHFNPIKDSLRIYMIFGKFLFSSLSSSVLDLLLFSLFCGMLRVSSGALGEVPYIVEATVLARIISAVYNFALNYKVVFKSNAGIAATAVKYGLLAVCQMLCSAFLVNGIYSLTGGSEVLVKIPVDVFLFFASFVIQREFVYRKKEQGQRE
ncbi:MAG: bifunctional glycosyltransferase family 2/GtrA family protein [Roseburia sp.]|nr:bifunctional glycosyltransferase family 2/GtrA family protein [Ruminococcus sp.]MCM1156250.1 bifunctional glycosyltransferase family 2/GtrA family protein [Roseburia sp.]MCM1243689.1 bifunctional glycosyltransferase family 2/GtrA family protein [Roseburia sp.]